MWLQPMSKPVSQIRDFLGRAQSLGRSLGNFRTFVIFHAMAVQGASLAFR